MIVVSDTSPVSNLILIGQIDLLRSLFTEVFIPPAVDLEIRALKELGKDISEYESAAWLKIREPRDESRVSFLRTKVDPGEAEAIALAIEIDCNLLLIDERLGSRVAHEQGLQTLGLVGVLIMAKSLGLIDNVAPMLSDLETIAGFWIGQHLKQRVLDLVGESDDS